MTIKHVKKIKKELKKLNIKSKSSKKIFKNRPGFEGYDKPNSLYGKMLYDIYVPPRTEEDFEYYDLKWILEKSKKYNDFKTWRRVLELSDLLFEKYPYLGCWANNFYCNKQY